MPSIYSEGKIATDLPSDFSKHYNKGGPYRGGVSYGYNDGTVSEPYTCLA